MKRQFSAPSPSMKSYIPTICFFSKSMEDTFGETWKDVVGLSSENILSTFLKCDCCEDVTSEVLYKEDDGIMKSISTFLTDLYVFTENYVYYVGINTQEYLTVGRAPRNPKVV